MGVMGDSSVVRNERGLSLYFPITGSTSARLRVLPVLPVHRGRNTCLDKI